MAMRIDAGPPFSALFALWLSMMAAVDWPLVQQSWGRRRRKRVVTAIPAHNRGAADEVVVDRAVRRKVLRKVAPLATGAQNIHHRVHDPSHVGPPLATTWLGRRNQWRNTRPLVIREVARVPQVITIVFRSVLKRPHRRPSRESGHLLLNPTDSPDSRSFKTDTQPAQGRA
jgi:hypothetical protein